MAVSVGATAPAFAHGGHGSHQSGASTQSVGNAPKNPARGPSASFIATLTGSQEVPEAGKKVGDPDGAAQALVSVKGDRVTFALKWRDIGAPSLGHIHEGKAGTNGAVKVTMFGTAMPDTVNAAAGQATVTDAALAKRLRTDPGSFYLNLHSKEFPDGAVRGQLKPVQSRVNPLSIIRGGALHALNDGDQEVPEAGKKVGDPDGHAITFLHPRGSTVDYSLAWVNIPAPSLGHIHQAPFGKNGPVKVPLFTTAVPQGIFAISGRVAGQDPAVVNQLRKGPADFYSNLHTTEFPDGAVRGQLFGPGGNGGQNNGQEDVNDGDTAGNGEQPTPRAGRAELFDGPNDFSDNNASQAVAGEGCQDVLRPGVASGIKTSQPVKVWSGKDCTGESKVITGDVGDLRTVNFDNKISSIFFGDV
ncbi:CHRD domain-containing protein [Streptomyces sp. NPDC029554]|uniref:CHRD domain-containing protein n=1 Tax=Streptomyces sp. NPDC029554 TaxID=3155126 RepID=UPI0033F25A25